MLRIASLLTGAGMALALGGAAQAQEAGAGAMSFFVTSVGSGKGADLGGLEGADAHCQALAGAVGAGGTWRAYLSTQPAGGQEAVNARDRIGPGPWQNVQGVVIATDVDTLHGENNLTKATAVSEQGTPINGRGDQPNMHDILTGSQPDGTAFAAGEDRTCGNWTKGGDEGAAMVGHHDRMGLRDDAPSKSWNSSHPTRGGCSRMALQGTGGAGLFYCFKAAG
jgi:hypothetical protein